jgi:monolysocardiolipin acyltransferase
MMPEGRAAPWKFLPVPWQDVSITFGTPVPEDKLRAAIAGDLPVEPADEIEKVALTEAYRPLPWLVPRSDKWGEPAETRRVRAGVAALLRTEVEKLGWAVSGPRLGKP